MTISTAQLLEELRDHVGVDSADLSDTKGLLLLNRSFWELCSKMHFKEKERTIPLTTQVGVRKYHVPVMLESIEALTFVDPDTGQRTPLERIGTFTYDNEYNSDVTQQARPEKYFREEDYIVLSPTPDATYTVELRHKRTLQDLEAAGTPEIPQEWHEVILMGAVSRAFVKFKDYRSAREAREYQASTGNSLETVTEKEQIDSHRSHFEVEGYDGNYV